MRRQGLLVDLDLDGASTARRQRLQRLARGPCARRPRTRRPRFVRDRRTVAVDRRRPARGRRPRSIVDAVDRVVADGAGGSPRSPATSIRQRLAGRDRVRRDRGHRGRPARPLARRPRRRLVGRVAVGRRRGGRAPLVEHRDPRLMLWSVRTTSPSSPTRTLAAYSSAPRRTSAASSSASAMIRAALAPRPPASARAPR